MCLYELKVSCSGSSLKHRRGVNWSEGGLFSGGLESSNEIYFPLVTLVLKEGKSYKGRTCRDWFLPWDLLPWSRVRHRGILCMLLSCTYLTFESYLSSLLHKTALAQILNRNRKLVWLILVAVSIMYDTFECVDIATHIIKWAIILYDPGYVICCFQIGILKTFQSKEIDKRGSERA